MHASPTKHEHTIPFWLYISAFYVVEKKKKGKRKKNKTFLFLPLLHQAQMAHHTTFWSSKACKPTDKC
jgi:type II secretory pathway component PulF